MRLMPTALILAGAVAKGAFEAGVLSVLASKNVDITSIVATSAGALNGAIYAAGLRFERAREAADVIRQLWEEEARWSRIVRPSLSAMLRGRGLSSTRALQALLAGGLERAAGGNGAPGSAPLRLELVTTRLHGELRTSGKHVGTTFEHAFGFEGSAFDDANGRERVTRAAVASAAFPFLFSPVELEQLGPCIDGGAVNNTPISYAVDAGVDTVIVVTGNPLHEPAEPELAGLDLAGQAVDIAINERLFRDLLQARKVNGKLAEVNAAAAELGLSEEQKRRITAALGWRTLEIVEIRPDAPLEGNAFEALGSQQLRYDYIQAGVEAAERALAAGARRPAPAALSPEARRVRLAN